MDSDKSTKPEDEKEPLNEPTEEASQDAPADALSKTNDELEEEAAAKAAENPQPIGEPVKKLSPFKAFLKKVNVYFLIFALLIVVAGAITIVNYLNSQKAPPEPNLATQELDADTLKQLANTDATVGNTSTTLTIQGNAIISGQTLMRGNLNVAGNIQAGGSIQAPTLTISGTTNLNDTQINSLQVATNTAIQGNTTMRDLSVTGSSTFNGAMTASQITVTRLVLSGNAVLEVPNHLRFTGASTSGSANSSVLGNGGSASVNGSDTSGTVNVNTGNNPTAGCFYRVNFRQAYASAPHVIVSPVGAGAGLTTYYVDKNASGFSICAASTPPNNRAFSYDYFISG